MSWEDIEKLPRPAPGVHIAYGGDSLQFGELRVPEGSGPFPVAIVIHGGCWRAEYDYDHVRPFAAALTQRGFATWTIEYRRIGNEGGGWPGTFEDVAHAADKLQEVAKQYPLDLTRVVAVGHSAGGHLALWLAARPRLPAGAPGASQHPLSLSRVVGLAAISDLREYARGASYCMKSAPLLMGGSPDSLSERYAQADPSELLPLRVTVRLIHGTADKIVPIEQSRAFVQRAGTGADETDLIPIEGAGHFDLVAPSGPVFEQVVKAAKKPPSRFYTDPR